MGECDEAGVRAVLHELARTDLVRPARRSSMEGQAEYSFAHALIREVCYGQIPRAGRARRHQQAAAWIEAMAGDRAGDHAEILAAHYTTALDLAQAANDPHTEELAAHAARYLMLAGDRALGIDVAAAERHYHHALQLTSDIDPSRAELLARHAEALRQRGRFPEAAAAFEQAIALFGDRDDVISVAAAMDGYGHTLQGLGDPRERTLTTDALALVEPLGPSPELVQALAEEAAMRMVWGDHRKAIKHADRALVLAAQLGLPEPARALGFRGTARVCLGDARGLDDMRTALAAATAQGLGRDVTILYLNLSEATWLVEGLRQRLGLAREGARFAKRRGIDEMALWLDTETAAALADLGALQEAMSLAGELALRLEETGSILSLLLVRSTQLSALTKRGEQEAAAALEQWVVQHAREYARPDPLALAYPPAAALRVAQGDAPGARVLLAELGQAHVAWTTAYPANLATAIRAALAAGAPDLAAELAGALQPRYPLEQHAMVTARALLAEHPGQHAEAAALFATAAGRWKRFEVPWEHAQALLGQGRCQLALGQPAEAREPLRTAREIFSSLGARPALAEVDRLLVQATAATA
jgi:tetratricopeptide (TPR) repeat protein